MRRPTPPALKTYSHLAGAGKVPSEYELVSSRLLYYVDRGFEIDVPVKAWYDRHQRRASLQSDNWERFADPRETTYTTYTRLSSRHEHHLDLVFRASEGDGPDRRLAQPWIDRVERILPPLRYVWHGLQMIAAYLGQSAPSGRLTLVALFQAADHMRRIHRASERMGSLRAREDRFGADALADWQEHPAWQPLRRVIEEALVSYDWGEAFAALCLAIAPPLDHLTLHELGPVARQNGDFILGELCASFAEDGAWHRAWAAALVRHLFADVHGEANRTALGVALARWWPRAQSAVRALAELFGDDGRAAAGRTEDAHLSWLRELGLSA
jgi:toluene monooxygenase system protein E